MDRRPIFCHVITPPYNNPVTFTMASTQPMGLLKKYQLLKEILSDQEPESIAKKYKCSVQNINAFKVGAVKFVMDFPVQTEKKKVTFSSNVETIEIPRSESCSQQKRFTKRKETEREEKVKTKKQKK